MRTTIVIDDHLFDQARRASQAAGRSMSDLIGEALRDLLARSAQPAPPPPAFRMPVFGDSGATARNEPAVLSEALERDDEAGLGR